MKYSHHMAKANPVPASPTSTVSRVQPLPETTARRAVMVPTRHSPSAMIASKL